MMPTPPLLHRHILREVLLFVNFRVEFDFLPSDGIDERHDDLEERVHQEGDVDYKCHTKSFGVMFLENVEDRSSSGEGWVLCPIGEINKKGEVSLEDNSGK